MNISNIINVPLNYFKEKVWNHLTPIQKLVSVVALVIISSISSSYLTYKWMQRPKPIVAENLTEKYNDYFKLLDAHPDILGPNGDYTKGEIEIIRDPKIMNEVATQFNRPVGIVYDDKKGFWIWANDVVKFPNGKMGIYGRIIWKSALEGPPGAAVMPVLDDGRIGFVVQYRHATRSMECELPRGASKKGEKPEDTAAREAKEEIGVELDTCQYLGTMNVDSGLTITKAPIYLAKVTRIGKSSPEYSEAIFKKVYLTMDQINEACKTEKITIDLKGKKVEANFRDPFLRFALIQQQALKDKGLLR